MICRANTVLTNITHATYDMIISVEHCGNWFYQKRNKSDQTWSNCTDIAEYNSLKALAS